MGTGGNGDIHTRLNNQLNLLVKAWCRLVRLQQLGRAQQADVQPEAALLHRSPAQGGRRAGAGAQLAWGAMNDPSPALLVAIGAVPGAWLRFRVVNHLEPMLPRKHWGTFGVNVVAAFALGLVVGLERSCGGAAQRLLLLIGTGFFGSFSTFSSFIGEVHAELGQGHWGEAALLTLGSVLAGLLALKLGLLVGGGP
jgi:fluoride exporter